MKVSCSRVSGSTLWTLGPYSGLLKSCIKKVKTKGHKPLARELAALAAEQMVESELQINAVLAVPSSQQGKRYRGFSLPAYLEEAVVERTGWPPLELSLRRVYRSVDKSSQGLSKGDRWRRQSVASGETGKQENLGHLLLLDDVVTTGATLTRYAAQAREQGFSKVTCFALAEYREHE